MVPPGQMEPEPASSPPVRVSDQDRDAVAERLQVAFAERRLDDGEFDERMRAALTARTSADLAVLTADLPAATARATSPATTGQGPGRFAIAYKGSIRRAGRWRVPEHFTAPGRWMGHPAG